MTESYFTTDGTDSTEAVEEGPSMPIRAGRPKLEERRLVIRG